MLTASSPGDKQLNGLLHVMTVLLECLTVLLKNIDLFEILSWFDINLSLAANLQYFTIFNVQTFTCYTNLIIIRASIVLPSN